MSVERRGNVYHVAGVSYRGATRILEITRNVDYGRQIADAPGLFTFFDALKQTNREDLRERIALDLDRGIVTSTRVETDKKHSHIYHLRDHSRTTLAEGYFCELFERQSRALLRADALDARLTYFWLTDAVPKFEIEPHEQTHIRFSRQGITASSNPEGRRYGLRIL